MNLPCYVGLFWLKFCCV